MRYFLSVFLMLGTLPALVVAQRAGKTAAGVEGRVVSGETPLPFVNIVVKGTTLGTITDASGHYVLKDLPVGELTVVARSLGYRSRERKVITREDRMVTLNFDLEEDVLGMDAVVVTGSRTGEKRKDAPVIINTISPKLFSAIQSVQIREGLDFCPGLRTETDCQNCGFSQLRINGMEGAYSQILINGHAIFSSLAGVYGLELLPSNMIERIEVVRGGGSALYGSNAIAGSVNILLKDPLSNTFSVIFTGGGVGVGVPGSGKTAGDKALQANASVVSDDRKAGMTLFGNYQTRAPFDANDDGLSEIPELQNTTFGVRGFHRIGYHHKLTLDIFHIAEQRRGGGPFDVPPHEAAIAESVQHGITSGSLTWDFFPNAHEKLSTFFSGQKIDRNSYYGARYSLKDYGHTDNFTWVSGTQYERSGDRWKLIGGAELRGETLQDEKLGYPDYEHAEIVSDSIISVPHMPNRPVADQRSLTGGLFVQGEYRMARWILSAGIRFDHYEIHDVMRSDNDNKGNVLSPRINLKYDLTSHLQLRGSFATGYRAPQIFDEDLHIASSGSRQVIIRNDPDLTQEKSQSWTFSAYWHEEKGNMPFELLAEGFYTRLRDPFVNEIGMPDEQGVVFYVRHNAAAGAVVKGVNMEFNLVPSRNFNIRSGLTLQQSKYEKPQDFGERRFFRTPSSYGYLLAETSVTRRTQLSLNLQYTGPMLVPYFGPDQNDPATGTLKHSEPFFNLGMKISQDLKLNGTIMRLFVSWKNIFNSWQRDFDRGIERDPAYIYGPAYPRTFYAGIRFGNVL